METIGSRILFEFLGMQWTLPMIGTAIGGAITAIGALYKIYERWNTREARHLKLLHQYLDKEEKDISSKRRDVFASISLTHHGYRSDKSLDVGGELDEAIALLDNGRPDRAEARLKELLKKIQGNSQILERRVTDLKKHERSLHIFLAALADNAGLTDSGLSRISEALNSDPRDLDALRYRGVLLLRKGDLDLAHQTFDRLRNYSTGSAVNRAEAHFGLANVAMRRGIEYYPDAERALSNALTNLNGLPPSEQSPLTRVGIFESLGQIYATKGWDQYSTVQAGENFRKALQVCSELPKNNRTIADRKRQITGELWKLENPKNPKQTSLEPTQVLQ